MLKPNESVLRALVALDGDQNFGVVKEWIDESYKQMAALVVMDAISPDSKYRVNQGKALNCYEIKRTIQEARAKLKAATAPENKGGN